jgi:transglutaminase-like putative cysteine protease
MILLGSPGTFDDSWWSGEVDTSLNRIPERRAEWVTMLEGAKEQHREGYAYLLQHMPLRDLRSLPTAQLVENVDLAYEVMDRVKWGKDIPTDVFLDAILPHVNSTEDRDPWRRDFYEKYFDLVKDAETPGEAALILNSTVFKDTGVHYNTKRLRPDQSPKQTLEQSMATCTGLSIMLSDLCRAVGVPARIAGIPSWPGRGGNHTWTEVWDGGRWHFVGAAEPDAKGLNHAWFAGEAANAIEGSKYNAIYAVTYRETGTVFPSAWGNQPTVNAIDVTARYAGPKKPAKTRLMVNVRLDGQKKVSDVIVQDLGDPQTNWSGESFGPTSDINFHLSFEIPGSKTVLITASDGEKTGTALATVEADKDTVVRITLGESRLTDADISGLIEDRFGFDAGKSEGAAEALAHVALTDEAKAAAWEAFKKSPRNMRMKRNLDENKVSAPDRESPYLVREVGEKPADGWGLYIAMHGGGSVPKAVHDRGYKAFFQRYNEHPEAGGYLYVSLRAPNDTWNGFYDDAICPLVDNLVKQLIIFRDVNPDKVSIMGYSHGGYGAFVIGPKMPWRFAAVHSSAAAPADGETEAINLMNIRFTYMIGEKDTAYGRMDRCTAFEKLVDGLRAEHGGFDNTREFKPGLTHGVLPDRDKAADMVPQRRTAWPKKLIWKQTDDVLQRFYWLQTPAPVSGATISAVVDGQTVKVESEGHEEAVVWLSDKTVDLGRPVTVSFNGVDQEVTPKATLGAFCESLEETADMTLASGIKVVLSSQVAQELAEPEPFVQKLEWSLADFKMLPVPAGKTVVNGKEVEIKAMWMSETEVLWNLYDVFAYRLDLTPAERAKGVDAESRPSKPYIPPDLGWGHNNFPAIHIHSHAAAEFCKWLSEKTGRKYRLPTVAEWEYVAKAGGGDQPEGSIDDYAWHWDNADDQTQEVKKKKPNAWGFYDMYGNAAEWAKPAEGEMIIKGGHYMSEPEECSASWKGEYEWEWQDSDPQIPKSQWWMADGSFIGIRIVCEG